jgi:phenylacetate-coenzyme A ligase PaaK-like adenylate-forming protein
MTIYGKGYSFDESKLKEFQRVLFGPTIENALRTKYYKKKYQHLSLENIDIQILGSLPITHKTEIQEAEGEAQVRDNLICEDSFTGGTSGTPFSYIVGSREREYCLDFFSSLYREEAKELGRALIYADPTVAETHYLPAPIRKHFLSIYKNASFNHGRKVLTTRYCETGVEERCSFLLSTERILRAFTVDTLKNCNESFKSDLRYIISYGQYITKYWQDIYEKVWGCQLIDRYGLSEIIGGATRDTTSGWYYFDPIVIPEVIGNRSGKNIREGVGILLLTPLFPFQECQPLIRYYTGDLVEVTHTKGSIPNRLAIRPLGRARYGVPASSGDEWLITPAEIYEVIDPLTSIERTSLFRDAKQIDSPNDLGHPIYSTNFKNKEDTVLVNIDVCLKRKVKDREKEINYIKNSLIMNNTSLKNKVENKKIKIEVRHKNDIEADIISYPT